MPSITTSLGQRSERIGLLSLPAEIRNEIYLLLLTSEHIAALQPLVSCNHCSSYVLPPLPLYPQLLSTCKQIYAEAWPYLYTCNTFCASPTMLTKMPYLVHPSRPICAPEVYKKIKRWYIKVRIDCDARFSEQDATDAFTGAQELHLEAHQSMFRAAGTGVLMLFRGIRGVGKAKVTGSVEDDISEWLVRSMMSPPGSKVLPFDDGAESSTHGSFSDLYDVWVHGTR